MPRNNFSTAAMLAVGLAFAAAAQPADAAEIQVNASGACKSALPVFDGNIRSRPLSVRNEGSAGAFVSCSVPYKYGGDLSIAAVRITNTGSAEATVNCTFVNGRNMSNPQYTPGSVTLAAGSTNWIAFYLDGPVASGGDLANFSCNLVPGTEIGIVAIVEANTPV